MSYNDEHYGASKAMYDGSLIELSDAVARYRRDEDLYEKYVLAERSVDENQLTWDDVEKLL